MKPESYLSKGIKITNRLINDIVLMCETKLKEAYFTKIGSNKIRNRLFENLDFGYIINSK